MKRICLLLMSLLFAFSSNTAGAAQWAGLELPAVTGNYRVGTVEVPMIDLQRAGVYADGSSSRHREIMTQIWYPADIGTTGPKSIYLDEATMEYMLKDNKIPGLDKNSRFKVKTHAVYNAPAAGSRRQFPVLIFSQGFGTSYFLYQSILEDLASHGYIVVGVNSPNVASITKFPHEPSRILPTFANDDDESAYLTKHFSEITADLRFVARQMSKVNDDFRLPLAKRVDVNRIGCFGHSYGGAAAIQAASEDSEIKAGANLDGSFWGEAFKRPTVKPMLLLANEESYEGDSTMQTFEANMGKASCGIKVKGLTVLSHIGFSDSKLLMASLTGDEAGALAAERIIQLTRASVRTFFDSKFNKAKPNEMQDFKKTFPEAVVYEH